MTVTTRSKPLRLAFGIVGALALSAPTVTMAADEFGVPKANIRYGDLNLATSQGAKTLYERIIRASYEVCHSFDRDSNDNPDPSALEACRRKIIVDAVTAIGKPALYAVYNAKNSKQLSAPIVAADSRK